MVSVAFFANGTPLGTGTTSPYSVPWADVAAGSYTLTAVATDNIGATDDFRGRHVTVPADPGRMNMALASNGGVATASSVLGPNYPASGAINGDRRGLNWGAGGGWNDGTQNAGPDWIEVAFNGSKSIDEVNVFSMQDSYTAPVEPTPAMTFTCGACAGSRCSTGPARPGQSVPGRGRDQQQPGVAAGSVRADHDDADPHLHDGGAQRLRRVIEVEAWGVPAGSIRRRPCRSRARRQGATFVAPATITLNATATDSDGHDHLGRVLCEWRADRDGRDEPVQPLVEQRRCRRCTRSRPWPPTTRARPRRRAPVPSR